MSFLVALPLSAYPAEALDGLGADSGFSLGSARAMMWMSQLAYETGERAKVETILDRWHLKLRAFASNEPVDGFPPHSACVVVAGGRGVTIVAFAGTDPLKIEDWITDFTARPQSGTGLHSGFDTAVETVWPGIETALKDLPQSEKVFFTGHSLGGALAILAAGRAMKVGVKATAVYTFGSPRTGGIDFFNTYTPELGDNTFRLVHGTDVVATVPPSLNNQFLHVGRLIQCPTDGQFSRKPEISARDGNKPAFPEAVLQSGLADFRAFTAFRLIRAVGPRILDRLAALLPRMVRDHIPANYFRALSSGTS